MPKAATDSGAFLDARRQGLCSDHLEDGEAEGYGYVQGRY